MQFWKPLKSRVQTELLVRGHCVACARSLAEARRELYPGDEDKELVICHCRRVFVYDKLINSYCRARLEEMSVG